MQVANCTYGCHFFVSTQTGIIKNGIIKTGDNKNLNLEHSLVFIKDEDLTNDR